MKPATTNKLFTPALTRLTAALVIAGQMAGLSAVAYADTATDIERRMSQRAMVQQAVYQLVAESRDADSDGAIEPPAMRRLSGAGPSDGGVIPETSGAPKTDGFGGLLGYCAWDTGTIKTGSNLLPGGDGAGAVTVAVLSYGLDNTYQTSCAHLAAGLGGQGDDYVFWMTANQVVANSSTNVSLYWGAPVASSAALQSLDKGVLHDGEVRLVQDTNQLYRWSANAAAWALVGQAPSWQATTESGQPAAYFDGKVAIGQTVFGRDMLTVNGKTFGALGLRGDTPQVGTTIYDQAGNNVKAFLGYHQNDDKLVLSATTGSLAIQVGGNERMLVRTDGSLALNGATVFDAQRNLSANRGSFAGNVDAPSFSVGGVSIVDSGRNLLNIGSLSAVGPANVNSLLIAGTLAIDSARAATLSSLNVSGAARVDGTVTANGGIITSNLVSTGQILGAGGTAAAPGYSFMGNSRSGMYAPAAGQLGLAADGSTVLTATTGGVQLPAGLAVTGGNFVLSGANTSGLLANRPAPGVAKRVYVTTDSNEIFLDTGSAWQRISATELAKLTDVALSSPATGQVLAYNAVTGKWTNASVLAGNGVTVASSSSGITVGLPATGTAGTYGSETQVPVFTTDAQGRVVSVLAKTITPAWASITAKPTTIAGYGITDINAYAPTLTGTGATGTWGISVTGNAGTATKLATPRTLSMTGDGTWSTTFDGSGNATGVMALATTGVAAGSYGSSTQAPTFTVDAKGRLTAAGAVTITPAWTSITGKPTTVAGYGITDINAYAPTLTGGGATGTWDISVTGSASRLTLADTRYVVDTPNSLGVGIAYDFKHSTGSGLSDGGSYSTVMSLRPWYDWTGGPAHQLAFSPRGNLWLRSGNAEWSDWSRILRDTDIGTTVPSIKGDGATGTWDISITGSAEYLKPLPAYSKLGDDLPRTYPMGISSTFVSHATGWHQYGSVTTVRPYSGGGGTLQLYAPYSDSYGGRDLQVRLGNYDVDSGNSWTDWKTLVDSNNIGTYAPALTGAGATGTWGISVTGNADTATKLATARTLSMTGDGTWSTTFDGTGNATGAMALATTGVTAGSYGSATAAPTFTVDAKGRLTAAGSVTITPAWTSITGKPTTVAGYGITDINTYAPTLTGVGASGTWGISVTGNAGTATKLATARTLSMTGDGSWSTNFDGTGNATGVMALATTGVTAGSYGSATAAPTFTVDAKGRLTAAGAVTITPAWTSITGTPTTVAGYGITDINAYAPTLAGVGASGTWGISVTGNAGTATKLATGRTLSMTGDGSWSTTFDGSGNATGAMTLANSGVAAGSYGSATAAPTFTVDSKGRLTVAGAVTITPAWSSVTGKPTTVAGYGITDINAYAPTLTGTGASGTWGISVTGNAGTATKLATARTLSMTGDGSWSTTFDGSGNATGIMALASTGVTAGSYGSATQAPTFTVDAKGRLTAAGAVTITPAWTSVTGTPTTVAGYGITDINAYAPSLTGTGASGTWGISVTGNAGTATKLATARTLSMTGDGSWSTTFDGAGNATGVMALASTGVTAGSYGSATQAPTFTVDAKGRLTAAGAVTITPAWTSITGKPTTVAGYGITDINTYAPTLTGTGATGTWGISVTGNAGTATKLAAPRTLSMTGDGTWSTTFDGSGNATGVMALANTGVTAGIYGSATQAPTFTVDAKGRLTAAGAVTITPAWSSITGKPTTVAGYGITDINSYAPTLTGAGATGTWGISVTGNADTATKLATARTLSMTGDGSWSTTFDGSANATGAMTLASTGVAAGSYGSATQAPTFTVDAKGRLTAAGAVTITPAWTSITGKPTTVAGYGITDINAYAPTLTGAGAAGTWDISVTGNAATATKLATPRAINGVPFDGSADIAVSEWFNSKRDFVNGTLITTNIDYSVTNGNPWVMELRGNSYGSLVPFDIQVQGYIWNNSLLNVGGYSNGSNIAGMVALNNNGLLSFWFPRQSYWQGFSVRVYVPYPGVQPNRVTAVTDEVQPAGATKVVQLSPSIVQSLHSSNFNTYAPTLAGTGATGNWGISVTGNAGTATKLATPRTLSMTGDGSWSTTFDGSANATGVMALATTGVAGGSYGSATQAPTFTVDAKGRLTAAGAVTITPAWSSITGTPTTVAGYGITDINAYAPTLTGVGASGTWGISVTGNAATATKLGTARTLSMTGDGSWSTTFDGSGNATGAMTLASTGVTAGSYGSTTQAPTFTVDAKGRLTAAGSVTITPAWSSITGKPTTLAGYGITDINSYVPSLTGTGATGTWGISVTGSADRLRVLDTRSVAETPDAFAQGVEFDFKSNSTNGLNDGGTYNGVMTLRPWGVASDWSGGSLHQLGFTSNGNLWHRTGTTAWGSWNRFLKDNDIGSLMPSVTGAGATGTWNIAITGSSYSATKLSAPRTISMTGDATWAVNFDGTSNVTGGLTLANSGVTAGSYGSSTQIPTFTVDAKGRITAAGTATFTPTWASITGKPTTVAGYGITDSGIVNYAVNLNQNLRTTDTVTFGQVNTTGGLNVTGNTVGDAFRADQGAPTSSDNSTNGYAFGSDGDTGLFSPIVGGGGANGVVSIYTNNAEAARFVNGRVLLGKATDDGINLLQVNGSISATVLNGNATSASRLTNARTISMTGDGSWAATFDGSGNVTGALTLANSGVTAGTYGSSTQIATFTVDAKGRITAAANATFTPTWASISGKPTTVAGYGITDINSYAPTLSGSGAYGTWNIAISGNAATATMATRANSLISQGRITAETGTARAPDGVTMREVYMNDYPSYYGNLLTLGGTGQSQMLLGWSGTTGAHADNYVRSMRDVTGAYWSDWAKLVTDVNIGGYAPTLTGVGASGTWGISVTGNAATATKLATARTISMTGDALWAVNFDGSTNVTGGFTLANTGVAAGNYGSAATVPVLTVDAKGRLTAASVVTVTPAWTSITGKPTTIAGYGITDVNSYAPTLTGVGASGTWGISVTGNAATSTKLATARTISMTGDATWAVNFDGSTNVTGGLTLASTGVTAGSYGSATMVPVFTVDAKGRLTAATAVAVAPAWSSITGKPTTIAGYGITDALASGGNYNFDMASNSNSSFYYDAAMELRELNHAGAQTGALSEAPRLAFNWSGRVASQIALATDGTIMIRDNPGTGYEKFAAGNITANGTLTTTGNATINGVLVGTWSGSASYRGVFEGSMSSAEYMIMSGGNSDFNTYVSAKSGGNVHIRPSANNATAELAVTVNGVRLPVLATSGAACGLPGAIARDANNAVYVCK